MEYDARSEAWAAFSAASRQLKNCQKTFWAVQAEMFRAEAALDAVRTTCDMAHAAWVAEGGEASEG